MTKNLDEVILGSGELYLMEYTGSIPSDEEFETLEHNVGHIKGGAQLSYTPTVYEVKADHGRVIKSFISKEEVIFSSGIMTWNLDNLQKLSPSTLTNDYSKKEKVLRIGGQSSLKNYALRFVHTKSDYTKLRITMVATAGKGFTLTFNAETETVIDAEFSAIHHNGILVEIRDQYETPPFTLVSSKVIDDKVVMNMSFAVKPGSVPYSGIEVKVYGTAKPVTSAAIGSDPNTIVLGFATGVIQGETITLTYTKPALPAEQIMSVTGDVLESFTTNVG